MSVGVGLVASMTGEQAVAASIRMPARVRVDVCCIIPSLGMSGLPDVPSGGGYLLLQQFDTRHALNFLDALLDALVVLTLAPPAHQLLLETFHRDHRRSTSAIMLAISARTAIAIGCQVWRSK